MDKLQRIRYPDTEFVIVNNNSQKDMWSIPKNFLIPKFIVDNSTTTHLDLERRYFHVTLFNDFPKDSGNSKNTRNLFDYLCEWIQNNSPMSLDSNNSNILTTLVKNYGVEEYYYPENDKILIDFYLYLVKKFPPFHICVKHTDTRFNFGVPTPVIDKTFSYIVQFTHPRNLSYCSCETQYYSSVWETKPYYKGHKWWCPHLFDDKQDILKKIFSDFKFVVIKKYEAITGNCFRLDLPERREYTTEKPVNLPVMYDYFDYFTPNDFSLETLLNKSDYPNIDEVRRALDIYPISNDETLTIDTDYLKI